MVQDIENRPTSDKYVGVFDVGVSITGGEVVGSTSVEFNGLIKQAIFSPRFGSQGATLFLRNSDDKNIYDSGDRASTTDHTLTFERAFAGDLNIVMTVDLCPTTATSTVTIYHL